MITIMIILGTVKQTGTGTWFAYGRTRVLGPFSSERAAWRALVEYGEG